MELSLLWVVVLSVRVELRGLRPALDVPPQARLTLRDLTRNLTLATAQPDSTLHITKDLLATLDVDSTYELRCDDRTTEPKAIAARLVHEQKLELLLRLERHLLFGAFEDERLIRRVLLLVSASLTQKLIDGGEAHDSASPCFAALLKRLLAESEFDAAPSPWREPAELPCRQALEELAPVARAELDAALTAPLAGACWDGADYVSIAPSWGAWHLWRAGEWDEEAARVFPRTVAALREEESAGRLRLNPLQNVACAIARQPAGSGISPHCDGNVVGLTAHLGLAVPREQCTITVGGETRSWEEGRVLLFDTTNTHATHNGGATDRYVLMLNVLRPGVSSTEVEAMRHFVSAASPRLDSLNAFYMWVGLAGGAKPGDTFVALEPAARNECGVVGVHVRPRRWLPMRQAEGDDGLVLVVPFAGVFEVDDDSGAQPQALPCLAAPKRGATLAAGCCVTSAVAAVDSDGAVEWIGLPASEEAKVLMAEAERVESGVDEFSISEATMRAHLGVMEDVATAFTWLSVDSMVQRNEPEEAPRSEQAAPGLARAYTSEMGARGFGQVSGARAASKGRAGRSTGRTRARSSRRGAPKK